MKRGALQGLMLAAVIVTASWWSVAAQVPDGRKGAVKKELEKLEGTWTLVSREVKGKKTPDDDLQNWQLTIKGDQWAMDYPGGSMTATIQLDPTKNPKTMDLIFQVQNRKIPTRGIYQLGASTDGDTLTHCRVDQQGLARPNEFKTSDKSGGVLLVWKRAKK